MKSFAKTYHIRARLEDVFNALTDPALITRWSGSSAEMDLSSMGRFSLWNGEIYGTNRLITMTKIVQNWYEKKWLKPSFVTFLLKETPPITQVELIHEEIPDQSYKSIVSGWDKYYMGPLIEMVESSY